jgi:hypothetical protein
MGCSLFDAIRFSLATVALSERVSTGRSGTKSVIYATILIKF